MKRSKASLFTQRLSKLIQGLPRFSFIENTLTKRERERERERVESYCTDRYVMQLIERVNQVLHLH